MKLAIIQPKQALSKAFLKEPVKKENFEVFKAQLNHLFQLYNQKEREEHQKNNVSDFLKNSFYKEHFHINTRHLSDLVIYTGKTSAESAGVIFETKKSGSPEMISEKKPNVKALHELILYYFRERLEHQNIHIRHLAITDTWNWFLFDENHFDKLFFRNARLKKGWETYKQGGKDTSFFYDSVAKPFLAEMEEELPCTRFNLHDFEKAAASDDPADEEKLIPIFKLLSPTHLLKLPFANDSNSLDKAFYAELLHLIGLEEVKEGSKKLIRRKQKPDDASLLENALFQLEGRSLDKIPDLKKYGDTRPAQLLNLALELCITWVNRILFLKLLEAQLKKYHGGSADFFFLNGKSIPDFDELNKLFFKVLAEEPQQRRRDIQEKFARVPFLNSSLFERTELEENCIDISNLDNSQELPIFDKTVLLDGKKKLTGKRKTLLYLFDFLEAYDFASEGSGKFQEQNKTLINASVLGLIFEKINGYKDGSFFTPGFVTMYMSREAVRRAVVQKFNERKGWNCKDFEELSNKDFDRKEANDLINSLKICDPAVGSGHFLVSALNEIIAVKSELKILSDRQGNRIKNYKVSVENDELTVTDEESGDIFQYFINPKGAPPEEAQRVQETLFHEKETIIENCLFGVDINPNSVKICRLRLWIELLKNAYYTKESQFKLLETLPNIDINIKEGNSLISRYKLNEDLREVFQKQKFNRKTYLLAVETYKTATSKEAKEDLRKFIHELKDNIRQTVFNRNPIVAEIAKYRGKLFNLENQIDMFGNKNTNPKELEAEKQQFRLLLERKEKELEEYRNSGFFCHSFEWRVEFPEVLNEKGEFEGFDVVIGNPPYGVKLQKSPLFSRFHNTNEIYTAFLDLASEIGKKNALICFIIPTSWQTGDNYLSTRRLISQKLGLEIGIVLPYDVFADAYIDTGIYLFRKNKSQPYISSVFEYSPKFKITESLSNSLEFVALDSKIWQKSSNLKINFNPVASFSFSQSELSLHPLKNISMTARGILADENDISPLKKDKAFKPFFTGKLNRYIAEKPTSFLKYGDNLKEKPSDYSFFTGERILVRRIISRQFRIMATMAEDEFVTKKDLYTIKVTNEAFSPFYILGILNSKLVSFLKTKESMAAKKDDFTQLTLSDIRELLIPEAPENIQEQIGDLVKKVLKDKASENETQSLETQIDRLVYKLYHLTPEEIAIVEKSYAPQGKEPLGEA